MSSPTDLELAIFRTICWFSVFDIPLSRFELWKWLLQPKRAYGLAEVDQALETSSWLSSRIKSHQGMYGLKRASLEDQTTRRHHRFLDASRKYKKLRRACVFFQMLPAVEAVAAVNTLAWWHTTDKSDIDLYIVTKPRHVWSTRFFSVLPYVVAGQRPDHTHGHNARDPLCFSFFSTTNALQLESLQWNPHDYYLAYWVKSIVPMYERTDVFAQLNLLNKWADTLLPNATGALCVHPLHRLPRFGSFPIQWSVFEPAFRWLQRRRFPKLLREIANKDSRVVISDDMLKFHENDRRALFFQQFQDTFERHV